MYSCLVRFCRELIPGCWFCLEWFWSDGFTVGVPINVGGLATCHGWNGSEQKWGMYHINNYSRMPVTSSAWNFFNTKFNTRMMGQFQICLS